MCSGDRLNGFGFLSGKQIVDAGVGNLGLMDQRHFLDWVQLHISSFGGDPSKVCDATTGSLLLLT